MSSLHSDRQNSPEIPLETPHSAKSTENPKIGTQRVHVSAKKLDSHFEFLLKGTE
jgi:hypothetical protein